MYISLSLSIYIYIYDNTDNLFDNKYDTSVSSPLAASACSLPRATPEISRDRRNNKWYNNLIINKIPSKDIMGVLKKSGEDFLG